MTSSTRLSSAPSAADVTSKGDLPLVSILIPAYNHAHFVECCLSSAIEEPYPNKELLVIDDGSTDDTADCIEGWIDRNRASLPIRYTRRPNKGITTTLNELVASAGGEYLRLGASDDYFLPGGIGQQVNYLSAHPQKQAVVGDAIVVDEAGSKIHDSALENLHRVKRARYFSDDGLRREVICRWSIGGPVVMLRKSAVTTFGAWSEDLRIDDWDFFLRLVAANALGFIDAPVGAYRIHGTNTSRTSNVAARIANLRDAQKAARRQAYRFAEPYRTLLDAQYHLLDAKVAFLGKRYPSLTASLMRFAALSSLARLPASALQRIKAGGRA